MKHLFFTICAFYLTHGICQEEEGRKVFVGINVGTKIANKQYAQRYAGWYNDQLAIVMVDNPNTYYQIYQLLGNKDFDLAYDSYPMNMRYTPGLLTGVHLGYVISPNLQTSIDANFSKCTSKDAFSIVVYDPANTSSEPIYDLGQLVGKESRFDGRYNFEYLSDGDKYKFIIGLSGIFTGWRIEQHYALFQNYQMPLYQKFDPMNNITNRVKSIGWGIGANFGIDFRYNDKFVAQLMYQPYHCKINVGIVPNRRLLLHHDIVLRVLWK